jgi:hypothetical protein
MTDFRDRPNATDRWGAMIDALEALMLAAPDDPAVDPAEAEEVRRLIMVRTARRRGGTLPAAWARRRGLLRQILPDTDASPAAPRPDEPRPHSTERPAPTPPAWHE